MKQTFLRQLASAVSYHMIFQRDSSHFTPVPAQVGIIYSGVMIENTVTGGPAHSSGQLHRGDKILKVDGMNATQARPQVNNTL